MAKSVVFFYTEIGVDDKKIIDTLYLSPLLFPKRPYHNLHKYKLQDEAFNNPVLDIEDYKRRSL